MANGRRNIAKLENPTCTTDYPSFKEHYKESEGLEGMPLGKYKTRDVKISDSFWFGYLVIFSSYFFIRTTLLSLVYLFSSELANQASQSSITEFSIEPFRFLIDVSQEVFKGHFISV